MATKNSAYHNANLLYRPSISLWTARKLDKAQSAKVNTEAGAVAGAANVYKQLLPESAKLAEVQKFAGAFRQWCSDRTLPWDDAGWRIGTVVRHMDFMSDAGDKMRQFDALVDEFVAEYAVEHEKARFSLNDLFNNADYPGVNEVRRKFGISLDVSSLPNTEDFRIVDGIPADEVERLVTEARTSVEDRVNAAVKEAYARLHGVVAKMAGTLRQYEGKEVKKFNDTLVTNIADVVALMPALNILHDPTLDALAAEAKLLTDYAPEDLRKDQLARKTAIKEAENLAKKFAIATGTTPPTPFAPGPIAPQTMSMAEKLRDMLEA